MKYANAPHAPYGWTLLQRIEWHSLPPDANGCRIWRAARTAKGYGKVNYKGKMFTVSRVLLAKKLGRDILPGMEACHTCDVPPCCTEDHLFEGTHGDNQVDMARKGRSLYGERHNLAKLSDMQVLEIRAAWGRGHSRRHLAHQYGVSWGMIDRIVRRQNWTHL